MKLYRLSLKQWDYDELCSVVVLAKNKGHARLLANRRACRGYTFRGGAFLDPEQSTIEKLNLEKSGVISANWNPG